MASEDLKVRNLSSALSGDPLLADGFHLEQEHPVICSSVARTASSCVINAPPTTGQDAYSTRKQRKKTEKKMIIVNEL